MNAEPGARERSADRIRDEFLQTLRELERRKTHALEWRSWARRRPGAWWGVALTGAVGALAVVWAFRRPVSLQKRRIRAAKRAWSHPERLASRSKDRPWPATLARNLLVAGTTGVVSWAVRYALEAPNQRITPPTGLSH